MKAYDAATPRDLERLRRKRRNRMVVVAFFCVIGIVVVLESPLTRVRSITVSGNSSISSKKLLQEAELHQGESLWQVNPGAIQHAILHKEPLVESVQVHRNFAQGSVALAVSQKKVVAFLQQGGTFFDVLNDGTVYRKVSTTANFTLPIITLDAGPQATVGERIKDSDVTKLCQTLSTLQPVQVRHMSQFTFDGLGSATLYMDNGYEIVLAVAKLSQELGSVQSVMSYFENLGYPPGLIDMSGEPPYSYTPFPSGKGN